MKCDARGHCWHEPDGSQHQRHSGRPRGTVKGTCCDCGKTAALPTHAQSAFRSLVLTRQEHGPLRPKPDTPAKDPAA